MANVAWDKTFKVEYSPYEDCFIINGKKINKSDLLESGNLGSAIDYINKKMAESIDDAIKALVTPKKDEKLTEKTEKVVKTEEFERVPWQIRSN